MVDGSDDFEARDEDVELWRRVRFRGGGDGLIPVGPGVRHPEDGELHNLSAYIEFPDVTLRT